MIDETFEVGGQRVRLTGRDARNPVLLLIPGAGLALSDRRGFFAPWGETFTVATWDQPFQAPLTYDGLAADGIAVVEALKARRGVPTILLATSGGTVVGLKMARARPELIAAYVGCGQVTDRARQEAMSYDLVLQRAREAGDAAAAAELEGIGPPPYADILAEAVKSKYANAPTAAEAVEWEAFAAAGAGGPDRRAEAMTAYMALREELARFDARALGRDFEVSMAFLQGADDAHTATADVVAYAGEIRAPAVVLDLIPGAGHLSFFLRGPMLDRLNRLVRPLVETP